LLNDKISMVNVAPEKNNEEIERQRAKELRMQRDKEVMEMEEALKKTATEAGNVITKELEKEIQKTEANDSGTKRKSGHKTTVTRTGGGQPKTPNTVVSKKIPSHTEPAATLDKNALDQVPEDAETPAKSQTVEDQTAMPSGKKENTPSNTDTPADTDQIQEPAAVTPNDPDPTPDGWAKDADQQESPKGAEEPTPNDEADPDQGENKDTKEDKKTDETDEKQPDQGAEEKKPHDPFDAPKGLGHQDDDGEKKDKKENEKEPSAKEHDQEQQRGTAANLARSRNQVRNKKKEDKGGNKSETKKTDDKAGKGFVGMTGLLMFTIPRDIFVILLGFIPFIGTAVLAFFGFAMALPVIFFIKKQDKTRLTAFIQKVIIPNGYWWAIAFAITHTITIIVLNIPYKHSKGGLVPGGKAIIK
jgi:hypothetical protein